MSYILVDTANTFFRARHVVRGDADIKLGMALHITFNSIKINTIKNIKNSHF